MMSPRRRILSLSRRYASDQRGAAAAEFALVLTLLTIPILNVLDVALYAWQKIQVDNAAQMGAQAARATCSYNNQPATINCPSLNSAVQTAVRSTSLGSNVTSSTAEHYYCTVSGSLVKVWDPPTTPPSDCSQNDSNGNPIGGSASDRPGDYILITVNHTYTPIFASVSVASHLASPITRTAWMRL
jgi:Flp pilus assembly protein TadG